MPKYQRKDFSLLFYNSGLIIWSYFSVCFAGNASTFTTNAGIYQKVYYPRLINPLSNCISALFGFSIQAVFFLGYFCLYKFFIPTSPTFEMTWAMLILPLLIPLVAFLGLGMGLWMSVLTAKYRDFSQITGFLAQALMYATPIIYPLSEVPDQYRFWASLNPMASVVETFRFALLGKGSFSFNIFCATPPLLQCCCCFRECTFSKEPRDELSITCKIWTNLWQSK